MRFVTVLVLTGALGVFGCSSDSNSGGTGATGGGGSGGEGGGSATGGAAGGGTGGAGGTGGGSSGAPVITDITWAAPDVCEMFTSADYTITVTAMDAEDGQMDLEYNGSVSGACTDITDAVSIVTCPNAAPYTGVVIVTDSDNNESDEASFTFQICESSSCGSNPSACTGL